MLARRSIQVLIKYFSHSAPPRPPRLIETVTTEPFSSSWCVLIHGFLHHAYKGVLGSSDEQPPVSLQIDEIL